MKKYVIMIMLVIGVSCIKIPKDQPIWWVTLRVPIGDSVVTVYDVLKEDPEKYEIIYDSLQPFIDSVYMLQTHLQESVQVNAPPEYQIFYANLRRSLPKEIDTVNSLFRSILFTMIGKVEFKGNATDTIAGYIHFTPWYWDTLTDTLQKWTRTGDTIVYFTFPPGPIDTVVQTVYDSFPFGPHKLEIRPYVTSGTAYFDTVLGVKRVLLAAQLLGDVIFTVEDTFETEKEIRKAAEKGQIARVRVILNIRHSLPAEAYGTIYLRGLEWPPDSVIDNFPFYAAPKDTSTGKSQGAIAWTDTIEISQHHFNVFQDSLVFYKVRVLVPQQEKAYLKSQDSLRVSGWVESTVLTDLEAIEE